MSRKRLVVAPGDDCSTMRRALDDESASIAVLLDLLAVDEFDCNTLSVAGLESVGGLREVGVRCCDRSWTWLVARSLRGDSARRAGGGVGSLSVDGRLRGR